MIRSYLCGIVLLTPVCALAQFSLDQRSIAGHQSGGFDQIDVSTEIFRGGDVRLTTKRQKGKYSASVETSAGRKIDFDLLDTPWDVNRPISMASKKYLIEQSEGHETRILYFIDGSAPRLLDSFRCHAPTISPDGRYVLYTAWYPSHSVGIEDGRYAEQLFSDFVMLYDVEQGRIGNRNRRRTEFPLPEDVDRGVGAQLYPLYRVNTKVEGRAEHRNEEHTVTALTWSHDSKSLIFVDTITVTDAVSGGRPPEGNLHLQNQTFDRDDTYLVRIELHAGIPKASRHKTASCPLVAGSNCVIDPNTVRLGDQDVTFVQHTSGVHNAVAKLHIGFDQFQTLN